MKTQSEISHLHRNEVTLFSWIQCGLKYVRTCNFQGEIRKKKSKIKSEFGWAMPLGGHLMYSQGSWTQQSATTASLFAWGGQGSTSQGTKTSTLPWPTRQCCRAGGADLGQGAASLLSVAQIMQQSPGSTVCCQGFQNATQHR